MSPVVGMLWRSSRAMGYPVCGERGQEATRIAGRLASAANQTAPVLIASAARDVLRGLSLVIPGVVGCAARYFWREHVGGARRVRRGACPCIGEGLPPPMHVCPYRGEITRPVRSRKGPVFCFNVFSAGSSVFFRSVGGWFSPVSSSCSQ